MFDPSSITTPFPDSSVVKIFPSAKPIPEALIQPIQDELNAFLQLWSAHGQPLAARCAMLYNHFLVVVVNDQVQLPSGCSIDSLFKKVVELELDFEVSLNDRSYVYFFDPENQLVNAHYFSDLPKIDLNNTFVLDLMCDRYHLLRDAFVKPLIGSPYEKLFS